MPIALHALLAFAMLLVSFLFGPGCKKEAPEASETSGAKVIKKPLLYRVSGPDGASGHLFGTMHAGIDAETELPKSVWKALDNAGTLAIETNIMDPSLAGALMRDDGTTLRDELGEEGWAEVERVLGKKAAEGLLQMKSPAIITALVMRDLEMTMPMEMVFLSRAIDGDKKREYLEAPSEQIQFLLETYTPERVLHSLREYEKEDAGDLLAAYRAGDEKALYDLMTDPENWGGDAAEAIERMLFARNRNWIPGIEKLLAGGDAFIAVGAGHLVGDKSVVALLREKGYRIERVP